MADQYGDSVAPGFVHHYPILLLDELTTPLGRVNRDRVIDLICKAKDRGTAIIDMFNEKDLRDEATGREIDNQEMLMQQMWMVA